MTTGAIRNQFAAAPTTTPDNERVVNQWWKHSDPHSKVDDG